MATSRTAKKRIRQTAKRRFRNKAKKSEIKTLVKKDAVVFEAAKTPADAAKATELYRTLQQKLDKAAGHALHKNTVARRKSRLARKLNKLLKAQPKA